ncbi:hypothetical protein F9U44_18310 [Pectobacterium versatile]|nr:hypothetical protein [Pectobacterium versatile]MBQ4773458.1 hypothetical protein [Pectobacterium versatile]
MKSLITNQNYIACIIAAAVFIATSDANHLRDSINYGLQAVVAAKAD